jgi:hypothetical protein
VSDRDLHWYLNARKDQPPFDPDNPHRGETATMEEVLAVRRRLTGADDFGPFDLKMLDRAKMQEIYDRLAQEKLADEDVPTVFLGALSRHRGDIEAAKAEMIHAFGVAPTELGISILYPRWQKEDAERRAEAEARIAAHYSHLADRKRPRGEPE